MSVTAFLPVSEQEGTLVCIEAHPIRPLVALATGKGNIIIYDTQQQARVGLLDLADYEDGAPCP